MRPYDQLRAASLVMPMLLFAAAGTPAAAQTPPRIPDSTGVLRVDVRMLPPAPPPATKPDTDRVYLVQGAARSHLWYVNSYLRHAFVVHLRNVPDERACRSREVEFSAPQGAVAAAPLTAPTAKIRPEWVLERADGTPRCVARVRWRLGEIPGRQTLTARLTRDAKHVVPDSVAGREFALGPVEWEASAHVMPALVAGFSYAIGPNPQPRNPGDSLLGRRGQPFFGAEFAPLSFGGYQRLARVSEHVRMTLGTSLRTPGKDFYAGVNPLVALDGLRTTPFPIQSTMGYRRLGRRGSFILGATANATSILGTFLGNVNAAAK